MLRGSAGKRFGTSTLHSHRPAAEQPSSPAESTAPNLTTLNDHPLASCSVEDIIVDDGTGPGDAMREEWRRLSTMQYLTRLNCTPTQLGLKTKETQGGKGRIKRVNGLGDGDPEGDPVSFESNRLSSNTAASLSMSPLTPHRLSPPISAPSSPQRTPLYPRLIPLHPFSLPRPPASERV